MASSRAGNFLRRNLNFFRIHLLVFTFTPLIFSAVLYASNGRFKIAYIDSLFLCVSSMTISGLATVDLSSLTPWQQTILFIEMSLGSPVLVSWVIVFIRKHYFAKKLKHIIEASTSRRFTSATVENPPPAAKTWRGKLRFLFKANVQDVADEKDVLRTDMIRRIDGVPKPVNPSGGVSEGRPASVKKPASIIVQVGDPRQDLEKGRPFVKSATIDAGVHKRLNDLRLRRRSSDPGLSYDAKSLLGRIGGVQGLETGTGIGTRTQTIEFAPVNAPRQRGPPTGRQNVTPRSATKTPGIRQSIISNSTARRQAPAKSSEKKDDLKNRSLGGFAMPLDIIRGIMNRFFPNLNQRLTKTVTVPRTVSLVPSRADAPPGARVVSYISFDAVVGQNSSFHDLTREQRDELGGVEYRALKALLWIVGLYHVSFQIICFIVIAPYISQPRWASIFVPPQQHRIVNPIWFSLFQVVSAYSNTGTSLVDQSMVPFQTAYLMIVLVIILILAGNAAYPIFLRFLIWIITKFVPKRSRANETLHFLLDHPRRCYTLLFPSHQTWFLLTIVLLLSITDWVFFLILNIGIPAFSQISTGILVVNGLLQAITVRTAGFVSISIAALAPAVKVMYIIMMYISVYPIAMSVRGTNVYEERSLGIFKEDDLDEERFNAVGPRVTIWGKYLALHARRQLAFDVWWLSLALFLICIIERGKLMDPNNASWFNIFNILFEIISAYGTVGLSTGLPYANFALSGAFRPLSKLIICIVMLRGRHRGLPVAIDRAVLLPSDFKEHEDGDDDDDGINNGNEELRNACSTNPSGMVGEKPQGNVEQ